MAYIRSRTAKAAALLLILAAWFGHPCEAGYFQDANLLYKNNKYDEAVSAYEKILEGGFESGALYYNLGNSYFKKGDLGRALLNYERAKIFIPHDSDLRSNHNFVRNILNVPPRYSSEPWFLRWLDRSFDGIAMNSLTVLAGALWFLILIILASILWLPSLKRPAVPLAVILAVMLLACSVALGRKAVSYERGALIIAGGVEAKFEPRDGATTYFSIPEGSFVTILDRSGAWVKVRRHDAKIGWVKDKAVAAIRQSAAGQDAMSALQRP